MPWELVGDERRDRADHAPTIPRPCPAPASHFQPPSALQTFIFSAFSYTSFIPTYISSPNLHFLPIFLPFLPTPSLAHSLTPLLTVLLTDLLTSFLTYLPTYLPTYLLPYLLTSLLTFLPSKSSLAQPASLFVPRKFFQTSFDQYSSMNPDVKQVAVQLWEKNETLLETTFAPNNFRPQR